MNLPAMISGRPLGRRGVHLLPFGHHGDWMKRADYWIDLLQSMHMSWVVVQSDSDSFYTSGAAHALLSAGIVPIVRFAYTFPYVWSHGEATAQLVRLYEKFDAPCIVQFANEPFDSREWRKGNVPDYETAWGIIAQRWNEAAREIVNRGAIAGFPDGPCFSENPFRRIEATTDLWYDGKAVYLGHFYGKGRPLDYPYDEVTQKGVPLTTYQYRADLDDFANDPAWNEGQAVLDKMNAQRKAWASPGKTAIDDDTCFNGWQKIVYWSRQAFGFDVPLAMTEGGWTPKDRAGSGGDTTDIRWPMTTPKMVAKKTLAMYEADTPMFALCPWLLAAQDMGGEGWPDDCWVGYAYEYMYGREKPVVQTLQQNPPSDNKKGRVIALLKESQELLDKAQAILDELQKNH